MQIRCESTKWIIKVTIRIKHFSTSHTIYIYSSSITAFFSQCFHLMSRILFQTPGQQKSLRSIFIYIFRMNSSKNQFTRMSKSLQPHPFLFICICICFSLRHILMRFLKQWWKHQMVCGSSFSSAVLEQ